MTSATDRHARHGLHTTQIHVIAWRRSGYSSNWGWIFSTRVDRTKVCLVTPLVFASAGVDPLRSWVAALYRYERRVRRIGADLICHSDFEPISTGSWERARVMETSSRRTLRGLSKSSQRQLSV